MKKRWFQKIISAGLVMSLVLGLSACGKGGNSQNAMSNADASLAKQCVFSEQKIELPDMGDDFNVRMLTQKDGLIYALIQVYNWQATDATEQNQMKLLTLNTDGSNVQLKNIQLFMEGEGEASEQTEAEEETAEETVEEASADTTEEKLASNDVMIMDDMAVMPGAYEYTGIDQCAIASDGMIYGVKSYYKEDYSDPEKPVNINENYICCWDMDGVMQWEKLLEDLQTEESYSYIESIVPMADGSVTLLLRGDKTEKIVLKDGEMSPRQPLTDNNTILGNATNIYMKEDGILNIIFWDDADGSSMKIATYDVVNDTFSESVKLPDFFMMSGYNAVTAGINSDMIFTNNDGVYSYNIGDEQPTQLLSYINSDMATTNLNNILMLDETHMIAFYYDSIDNKNKGAIFTKVNPEDIPDKEVLLLAGYYVGYDVKNRIVDFNKNSDKYRIVLKEYQTYATMDDYMIGYTQLNNDIISGGMPDILVVDSNIPTENYISKGLLADIGSLIAKDEELSQKEYMENVFEAYKVNGKLYHVIPSFNVRTLIGKKSIVGDRTGWTMKDMQELMATLPEGTQAIGELTRGNFLYNVMQYCGSDFVDVSSGKCNFDSPDFIAMLEYAKNLPEELGEDFYGEDYWMTYESQYREDRTILMNCYISDARNMSRNINGYFGEEISYIGFPTESGKGAVLSADESYALSSRSKNLEGAWEFVRYYLTDEYQNEKSWSLPVSKEVFNKKLEEAMQNPYYEDENGEKVEYEDVFYINNEEVPLPNMSQEQADTFKSFVEGVDKCSYYNQAIQNIIDEEAPAFFEGQKSVQDVVGIIQSRAQIYVNENR